MMRLLERLVPAGALAWDRDRPFAEDWHVVWDDPRYERPRIRDLLPAFTADRGPIVFAHGDFSQHFIPEVGSLEFRWWRRVWNRAAVRAASARDALLWRAGYEKRRPDEYDEGW